MSKFLGLMRAAHFGPTMIVTSIAFLLAKSLWWEGPAYVIAVTVFLGQLIIGWSNDIYDYQDDLKHNRRNKPLVSGKITTLEIRKAIAFVTPIAVVANLLGPLGVKGGSIYLLGVACGLAYNFYFKFSLLSPIPYAIACAALPASIFYAVDLSPPPWVLLVGSLLGIAFHFLNVLKDLTQDLDSKIGGLPQRLGRKISIAIIILLVIVVMAILFSSPVTTDLSSKFA